jgi:hypothetical protein
MNLDKLPVVALEKITENCYYNQISQTSEIKWSLLNRVGPKEFKELHLNVLCREYFGDAVVCSILDIDNPPIYGFSLIGKRSANDETLLSVCLSTVVARKNFINHFHMLRQIERSMGISTTKIRKTQHPDKLVLIGDAKWSSSPLLISLYTQIIRSFTYVTPTTTFESHIEALISGNLGWGNDVSAFKQFQSAGINLKHLLKNIDEVLGEDPLTGLEDLQLIDQKDRLEDEYTTVSLKHTAANGLKSTYNWCISYNHGNHGIVTFAHSIEKCKAHSESPYQYSRIGCSWVQNYMAIVKRELSETVVVQEPAAETIATTEEPGLEWDLAA